MGDKVPFFKIRIFIIIALKIIIISKKLLFFSVSDFFVLFIMTQLPLIEHILEMDEFVL